jgi:hypothetical protein
MTRDPVIINGRMKKELIVLLAVCSAVEAFSPEFFPTSR